MLTSAVRVSREVSLDELTQVGALFIRKAVPHPAGGGQAASPGFLVREPILTARDVVRGVPPSGTAEASGDELQPCRPGG
jgi:hypothetical protein